jgi:predicted nucleic acid-binding protein
VTRAILLDSGPLGLLSNPAQSSEVIACNQWLAARVAGGDRVLVPEIVDYEVRRELLRANKTAGLTRLDALAASLEYLPLNTSAMRRAALLWHRRADRDDRPRRITPWMGT